MKPVGILGGMGPQATVLLMQKAIDAVPARDDSDHLPLIVHQNPQVPSRIAALLEGGGPSPAPVLADMARDLARAGAGALAMPCNTAHLYASAVRAAVDIPFLDMRAATARAVAGRRVGMLASPAVRQAGVFDGWLDPVWPDDETRLLGLIRSVKAGGGAAEIGPGLRREGEALLERCDLLVVACTELSLATGWLPEGGWVDTLDCLVSEIAAHAQRCGRQSDSDASANSM